MLQQKAGFIKFITALIIILEFIYLFLIYFHTEISMTQDLGRHLKLGEIILAQKKILDTNTFSYTFPDFPFINHHWGSEMIFYQVNKYFSVNGLILLKTLMMVTTLGMLISYAIFKNGTNFIPFILIFVFGILIERTDVRPEIFGYFLYSVTQIIIYQGLRNKTKILWILPFLSLFWVNLHISFIMCPAIYIFFIIDRIIHKKITRQHILVGIFIFIALLFNPYGFKGMIYPFEIFKNYGYSIVENQSPFFLEKVINNPTILYFKLSIIVFFIPLIILIIKKHFFESLVIILMSILSVNAIRNFPLFALSLIYPMSVALKYLTAYVQKKSHFKNLNIFPVYIAMLILLWCFVAVKTESLLTNRYYKSSFSMIRTGLGTVPGMEKTLDFFIQNNLKGPIFNNFDIGSYLIYRLYPKEKVFVDGRPEAYPKEFFQNTYIPMQEDKDIWDQMMNKYQFNTIVFSHTDMTPWAKMFVKRIIKDSDWKLAFFDEIGFIMVLKGNQEVGMGNSEIYKRAISLLGNSNEPDKLVRLVNFYNMSGLQDAANVGYEKLKMTAR